ncbi:Uncharacterised protein [Haemophilus parahaemolyticus]|uniref:GTPase Era n=1 Tax=Haemophilus parahaemolyticus TaxID=735 RepID=A0A377I495_HAEPH|nr:Uncharacterised protein [Haemophilus parahaemolyticus]
MRYSPTDYIEAVQADGNTIRYEISQLTEIKDNAHNFKFLRLFLNNPNLAEIQPLVLVDMPGFDAPIENHRNAILEYLNRGTYFIFLTSIEDGTITRSMHQEIKNLRLFGKGFAFCLSKTNLRSPSDVKTVQQAMQSQLKTQYRFNQDIVLLDDNGGENLKQILVAVNPEELFKSLFIDDLQDNYFRNEESLRLTISTLKTGKEESDAAVQSLQEGIQKLQVQKSKAIEEVEQRYSHQAIDRIADNVGQSISAQRENLISLAVNNPTEFQRQLSDVVQSSLLVEVKSKMQDISSDIVSGFRVELQNSFNAVSQNFQIDNSFINRIADNSERLLQMAQSGLKSLSENVYRTIASIIGITTSIVSPVVEVALIFLPEILGFLTQGSKEEQLRRQQQEQRSAVERQILMEIIPQIKNSIRQELPPLFQQNVSQLIQQVAEQFEQELAQKQTEINQAIAEKETQAGEIDARITQLENVKQQLSDLAKLVLFA